MRLESVSINGGPRGQASTKTTAGPIHRRRAGVPPAIIPPAIIVAAATIIAEGRWASFAV